MNRRSFLKMGALVAAPYVITTPGLLMPVRQLFTPSRALDSEILGMYRGIELLINPPLVFQRLDLPDKPWMVHQVAAVRGGVHVFDFAEMYSLKPLDLTGFERMAGVAFRHLLKKEKYIK